MRRRFVPRFKRASPLERLRPPAPGERRYFLYLFYIAKDSERAANRVEFAIYEACDLVAEDPRRGHIRRDLTARPVRFWTLTRYSNYAIVYGPRTTPVQIIAVHDKRNLRRDLARFFANT
jgi:plasmid stabilization system protein ParE